MNPPTGTAKMPNAVKAADPIIKKKTTKRDLGKPNNGKTTGFSVVAKKAAAEYGSKAAGDRVAGAIEAKMRSKGTL